MVPFPIPYLNLAFILLSIFQNASTKDNLVAPIQKCCKFGEVLNKDLNCVTVPPGTERFYDLRNILSIGLPKCIKYKVDSVSYFSSLLHLEGCLEVYYEEPDYMTLVFVWCAEYRKKSSSTSELQIINSTFLSLRICCLENELFDLQSRYCIPTRSSKFSPELLTHVSSFVDFLDVSWGAPFCEEDFLVDYKIATSNLYFRDNKLWLKVPWADNGLNLSEHLESICIDGSYSSDALVVRACRKAEYCLDHLCVRKCCPVDQNLQSIPPGFNAKCIKIAPDATIKSLHSALLRTNLTELNDFKRRFARTSDYGLSVGTSCIADLYTLVPEDKWQMTLDGDVVLPDDEIYSYDRYCMDTHVDNDSTRIDVRVHVCEERTYDEPTDLDFTKNASLVLTSCFFMVITFTVYMCLPELQNIHGKTLMCYLTSLFVTFICLAIAIFNPTELFDIIEPDGMASVLLCKCLGFVMLFSIFSTFSWLNVMCFDIWWTIGCKNYRSTQGNIKKRNKFYVYCLFAWGIAFVLLFFTILFDYIEALPVYYRPKIGQERCWFTQNKSCGELLFYTVPVSIQLFINLIFFILTAINYGQVKSEINRVMANSNHPKYKRFQADKDKLSMCIKLFLVMGITWLAEVLPQIFDHFSERPVWINTLLEIFDVINALQGVIIFVLFVLKRNVFLALKKRYETSNSQSTPFQSLRDPNAIRRSGSSATIAITLV